MASGSLIIHSLARMPVTS